MLARGGDCLAAISLTQNWCRYSDPGNVGAIDILKKKKQKQKQKQNCRAYSSFPFFIKTVERKVRWTRKNVLSHNSKCNLHYPPYLNPRIFKMSTVYWLKKTRLAALPKFGSLQGEILPKCKNFASFLKLGPAFL